MMGLNDTLDRLRADMERRSYEKENLEKMLSGEWQAEIKAVQDKVLIANIAERIFFQRMLKDINPGMSEPKIEAMLDRSMMIATKLYNKLYK